MSYSLAAISLVFLAALGNELRRIVRRGNHGIDFGIVAARGILGSAVWGLIRLGCLGDVSMALGSSPLLLLSANLLPAAVRHHPAVVCATHLSWFALGLVFVTVDYTVNRCLGHSHNCLDHLVTDRGANDMLAEKYAKWRHEYDEQRRHLSALIGDLSRTSKEFNARLPLLRDEKWEAGPRRPNCTFSTFKDVKMEEFNIFYRLCKLLSASLPLSHCHWHIIFPSHPLLSSSLSSSLLALFHPANIG